MTKYIYNRYMLILIVLGLFFAIVLSVGRSRVENANRSVEMIYEYGEVLRLAADAGKTPAETMKLFKDSGITSLAVFEVTLEHLVKRGLVAVTDGADLLAKSKAGLLSEGLWREYIASGQIAADAIYITASVNGAVQKEIEEDLAQRFGADRVRVLRENGPHIIAVKGDHKDVMEQHLGILSSDIEEVARHGFKVIARPTNYHAVTPDNIKALFARLDKTPGKVSGLLFTGQEVLGFPDELPLVAAEMNKRGLTLGMTEHPLQLQFDKQAGLVDLGKLANYQVARLYVIDKTEQEKRLDVPQALRRWSLTDEERNVRMNYIRSFWAPSPGMTLLETNLDYVAQIRDSVAKRGFSFGPAGVFQPYLPNKFFFIPLIFGAVAAGVLYLSTLTARLTGKRQLVLTLVAGAALSLPFAFTDVVFIRQAVALLSAVIFPVLSIAWQLANWEKLAENPNKSLFCIIKHSIWQLAAAVFLSLAGGAYISGILGDINFMLEMDIYRGVKLTFLLPLVLVTLIYLKRYNVFGEPLENKSGLISQLRELMDYPVQLKTLFCLGVGAVVAYIFIGRTGHTAGLPVPGLEIKMRYFLEEVMYARPREKEFLVGHPSFFLAALAASRNLPHIMLYCLVIGATIGQGCLVETFAHMRTPVLMSFIRALDGLWMGAILGIIAVLGASACLAAGKYLKRRYAGDS